MRISDWSSDVCSSDLAGERNGGIASLPKSIGAQLGKGEGRPLLVAVHQQEVAARKLARHREVDGKGRLADTALSVSDCQYHSALAPLAIWLRCSMVCNAKGYTFDWGAYSPSSPSSSLSSSSGSGSSGRDPRSGK